MSEQKSGRAIDPSKAPKNSDIAKILAVKAENPKLNNSQLAKIAGISKQALSQMFQRYGIDQERLEEFKASRADIFAGLQETILSTLTCDDIKKASVRDRIIAAATLYDKERLERGQSTSNVSVLFQIGDDASNAAMRKVLEVESVTPSVTLEAITVDSGKDNR